MIKKSIPHLVKKQISEELLKQEPSISIVSQPTSISSIDQIQSIQTSGLEQMVVPYLQSVLGNRIIDGYRVIRTPDCTGMNVFIMPGVAVFDLYRSVKLDGGKFFEVPVYSDDQWVYVYLEKDGNIIANKYSPIVGDNLSRIPLAMIWVEAGSTEVNAHFIIDIRPNKVANLSEIYGVRQQTAELYNVIPNSVVGSDKVIIEPVSGELKVRIVPNQSAMAYMQGHAVIIPETIIDLSKPDSGSKDYWILAHAYIDNVELVYKIMYLQVEVGTPIERFQLIIGRINGITPDTQEITSDMIDQRMQRSCFSILDIPYTLFLERQGDLNSGDWIGTSRIVQKPSRLSEIKLWFRNVHSDEQLDNIVIKIYKNGNEFYTINIDPYQTNNEEVITVNLDQLYYINQDDVFTARIISIPQASGYSVQDLLICFPLITSTIRPEI
jgi:hypothetical protein